jgi:hypothetical protein
MTATPSSEARAEARAEAERRYPAPTLPGDNIGLRVGFVEGAEWKGAQASEEIGQLKQVIRALLDGAINELGIVQSWDELYDRARALSGVEADGDG